eukprot:CAMPEP_0170360422 /NCGR_PEP_ID=MMETSP0117_2-20130122/3271_1 /TAXON_ID=400756 /ORGANISM="Durinskia baltica, Strain CSIRO CS-38" /LENGTH=157 /DNA_ID=CAMNT_0010614733 /DNA_START=210 /DNA_END=683 /DNA_ORIENTATION=-
MAVKLPRRSHGLDVILLEARLVQTLDAPALAAIGRECPPRSDALPQILEAHVDAVHCHHAFVRANFREDVRPVALLDRLVLRRSHGLDVIPLEARLVQALDAPDLAAVGRDCNPRSDVPPQILEAHVDAVHRHLVARACVNNDDGEDPHDEPSLSVL